METAAVKILTVFTEDQAQFPIPTSGVSQSPVPGDLIPSGLLSSHTYTGHKNSVRHIHRIKRILKVKQVLEFENCLLFPFPTLIEKKMCHARLQAGRSSKIDSEVLLYKVSGSVS